LSFAKFVGWPSIRRPFQPRLTNETRASMGLIKLNRWHAEEALDAAYQCSRYNVLDAKPLFPPISRKAPP
jgi:hypothetical protein